MKHASLSNSLLLTIIILCASSAATAKDLSATEHLIIGKGILNRLDAGDPKSTSEKNSAIQQIKTAISLGLNYEDKAKAVFLIAKYSNDDMTANEHFELGKTLIEANHYDSMGSTQEGMEEGIRQMKEAIRLKFADLKTANIILANAYDQMLAPPKENSDADKIRIAERDEILLQLYKLYPDDLQILDMYVMRLKNKAEKFVVYKHMKEIAPQSPTPHFMLGILHVEDGRLAEGTDEIKTWLGLETNPSAVRAYARVAIEHMAAKGCVVPEADYWHSMLLDVEMAMEAGESHVREQGRKDFESTKQKFLNALNETKCHAGSASN